MKVFGCLLAVVLAAAFVKGGEKCIIRRGVDLDMFTVNHLKMKIPCKYNMINSMCGPYQVTITPGNRYLYPGYIIDSVWVTVNRTTDGAFWSGRTTNRETAKFLIGRSEDAFNQKSDNKTTVTSDLFEEIKSFPHVILREKDGVFNITYTPFDIRGKRHSDNELEFECNAEREEVEYPEQFCGYTNKTIVNDLATRYFRNRDDKDMLIVLDVFRDTSIVQTDPKCQKATKLMTKKCRKGKDVGTQIDAARICSVILTSEGHRICAMKYACDPMDVFNACLDYVCGGFDRKAKSCAVVGRAIDLCRNFPNLTEPVKKSNCFNDFLTQDDILNYNMHD